MAGDVGWEDRDVAESVVWTVGHSNHGMPEFLALLQPVGIQAVADVRSDPDRVYREHFKQAPLRGALAEAGIDYVFLGAELGGRPRAASHFDDEGRARYDLMAAEPVFGQGLARLRVGAQSLRVAVMCSEANPLECHRRLLVGRALSLDGVEVLHIRSDGCVVSEAELVEQEGGQPGLFGDLEVRPWRSARSVPPSGALSPSSEH